MRGDGAPRFLPQGDAALVVEFGDRIDPAINARVHALAATLAAAPIAGMVELVPTFRSLCLHYDPLDLDFADLVGQVRARLAGPPEGLAPGRRVTIPVCYEGDLAPDLADVATRTGLTPDEVVRLHAASAYRVFMLGFLPGFAYMGSLPERLRLPRRASPRVRVPAGSVAIAMEMTAIYPLQSPGGWHLIGSAPTALFDITADPPALLRPGDEVRFEPVGRAAFEALRAAWQDGSARLDFDVAPP